MEFRNGFCLAATVVIALAVGSIYKEKIPVGFKNPWKLKCIYALARLAHFIEVDVLGRFNDEGEAILSLKSRITRWPSPEMEALPVDIEHVEFNGVKVLVFKPRNLPTANNPGIVQIHGGGWTILNTDFYQDYCRLLAHRSKAIVASVEYRLAPEHIYPAAFDDCVKATIHFIRNAPQYGVDENRVALVGDSAGGNLVGAVSIKLRDIKFQPSIRLQVLIYPCTQAIDMMTPSYQNNQHDAILSQSTMAAFWLFYAVGHTRFLNDMMNNRHVSTSLQKKMRSGRLDHEQILKKYVFRDYQPVLFAQENKTVWEALKSVITDPYFAPLMSDDLSNLPEALVVTVGQDVLRDDGYLYAEYLKSFGVTVKHEHYAAGFHPIVGWPYHLDENTEEVREIIHQFIRDRL